MKRNLVLLIGALLLLNACGSSSHRPVYSGHEENTEGVPGFVDGHKTSPYVKLGQSYSVDGETYVPHYQPDYVEVGMASWYGPGFHGGKTANGEEFDTHAMTGAHRTLPLPSIVKVTLLSTGKSAYVRINDRGPFAHSRIIDLSYGAAKEIGLIGKGVDRVKVEYMPQESQRFADLLAQGREPNSIDLADEVIGQPSIQMARNDVAPGVKAGAAKASLASHLNPIATAQAAEPVSAEPALSASIEDVSAQDLAAPAAPEKAAVAVVPAQSPFAVMEHGAAPAAAAPGKQEAAVGSVALASAAPMEVASVEAAPAKEGASAKEIVSAKEASPAKAAAVSVNKTPVSQTPTGHYFIQLGAFLQQTNAERLRIKAARIAPTRIETKTTDSESTFFVVRMGPYETVDESTSMLAQLSGLGVNPKIVSK